MGLFKTIEFTLKNLVLFIFLSIFLSGCSSNRQTTYISDNYSNENNFKRGYSYYENSIAKGDVLKIDVVSLVPEASIPYNKLNLNENNSSKNIELLILEGYLVNDNGMINFPVLGQIKCIDLSLQELENKITNSLNEGNHLSNPSVTVRRINSRFTVLGEVSNPNTFSYYDEKLNIFQALGYAGDITIYGKRKDITLIREINGIKKVHKLDITKSDILDKSFYQIKNNDILIVNPSWSKIKSAGFIGSPSSIASISSLLLSITLLILNK